MTKQHPDSHFPYAENVLNELYPLLDEFFSTCGNQARPAVVEALHEYLDRQAATSSQDNRNGSHLSLALLFRDQAKSSSTAPDPKPEAQRHVPVNETSDDPESQEFDIAKAIIRVRDLARTYLQEQASEEPLDSTPRADEKEDGNPDSISQDVHKLEQRIIDQIAWLAKAFYPVNKQQVLQIALRHNDSAGEATDLEPISPDLTCDHCGKIKQAETDQYKNGKWIKNCMACRDNGNNKPRKPAEKSFATRNRKTPRTALAACEPSTE